MRKSVLAIASIATMVSGCAVTYRITPIESPPATVRYDHGAPTTSLAQQNGAVQVTPMPFDSDGRMVFGVAAYNSTDAPANFGVENIETRSPDSKLLHVFTADDLIRDARNKAIAASVALALIGVAGAVASQAAAHQTYHSSYYTPRGSYHYKASYYDGAQAVAGTAASIGGATAGIYAVNRTLDATIAGIGDAVLQTTTVDPGESVGGRVLVQRSRSGGYPQDIAMLVRWNGEEYPFRFQVTKSNGRNPQPARPANAGVPPVAPPGQATTMAPASPQPTSQRAARQPVAGSPVAVATTRPVTQPPTSAPATRSVDDDDAYNERIRKEQASFER